MATYTLIPSSNTTLNKAGYTNVPSSNTTLNKATYSNLPTGSVTPDQITNLEMWLKADDIVGNDGDAVATWTKSGGTSGVSPTQATAGQRPVLKKGANGINGVNVVRFDGSNDTLYGTLEAGSSGFTVFIVGRTGGAVGNYDTVVSSGGAVSYDHPTTGIGWAFARGAAVDGFGAGWGGPTQNVQLGNIAGVTTSQAFYARYRTNKIAWSIDGPNSGTPADTSFPTGTFQFYVGSDGTTTSGTVTPAAYPGDVGEVAVYSRALTDGECAQIKSYLAAKWGTLV